MSFTRREAVPAFSRQPFKRTDVDSEPPISVGEDITGSDTRQYLRPSVKGRYTSLARAGATSHTANSTKRGSDSASQHPTLHPEYFRSSNVFA